MNETYDSLGTRPMDHETDKALAQQICEEIQSGNRDAISEIRKKHQRYFIPFARQSLSDPECFLEEFWDELSDGKVLCRYKGDSSLKCFLINILKIG